MNNQHMYLPWQPMGMQANQSQDPRSQMMAAQNGPQQMGSPSWANQMGPQPMPAPGGMPAPMANGPGAMTPNANPIDPQVQGMMGGEGMTGQAPGGGGMQAGMMAAQMGMNMMQQQGSDSSAVIQRRQQMSQQGLDRMQQIAAAMRQRMGN